MIFLSSLIQGRDMFASGNNSIKYVKRGDPSSPDFTLTDFTTAGSWAALDLSSIVPAGVRLVHVRFSFRDDATRALLCFRDNDDTDVYTT